MKMLNGLFKLTMVALLILVQAAILHPATQSPRQVIILKADDCLKTLLWDRFFTYIQNNDLKASIGIVAKNLYDDSYVQWLKSYAIKANFQIWNHGLTHFCGDETYPAEFKGSSYESQFESLRASQKLIKEKLGFTNTVFGAGCNYIDNNTSRALADIEEIKIWYYGRRDTVKLNLERHINIEHPTGVPNYDNFVQTYQDKQLHLHKYLLVQIHPGWWGEDRWEQFEKIIAFLQEKNVVFMTGDEYFQHVNRTITVTTTAGSGPGSLREAISNANAQEDKSAVIELPAGTFYLNGTPGENNNISGDLDIYSSIVFKGAGAGKTIIDGNGKDRVFHIHDGQVTISGITIRNGRTQLGGGIRVDGGTVAVQDCTVTQNTASTNASGTKTGGAGIYVQNAKISIYNSTISNNYGSSPGIVKGGGIWANLDVRLRFIDIKHCTIKGNIANKNQSGTGLGGGLYLLTNGTVYETIIIDNVFNNNIAGSGQKGQGGAVYIQKVKEVVFAKNRFQANIAASKQEEFGENIAVNGPGTISMINNLCVNSNSGTFIGSIYLKGSSPASLLNITMFNNTLVVSPVTSSGQGRRGPGIYIDRDAHLTMTNNVVTGYTQAIYKKSGSNASFSADCNLFYNDSDPLIGNDAILQPPLLDKGFCPSFNSPAVDSGRTIVSVTQDLNGSLRPNGDAYDIGCFENVSNLQNSTLILDKTQFNFSCINDSTIESQWLKISNNSPRTVTWAVNVDVNTPWVKISPDSGINQGNVKIDINPRGLSPGNYTGAIEVFDIYSPSSPIQVRVNLTIYRPGQSSPPFGVFSTPQQGTKNASGSIPVTGWVLDDIKVDRVEIYGDYGGQSFYIDNAVFIEGCRPDVKRTYPDYPNNNRAGWGYMLLSNQLPGGGNGTYNLYVKAIDIEGNCVLLGVKTITFDNAGAVKPFGALDAPGQGGTASGKEYINWGWALTPLPNAIPSDGSTIDVWIDGVKKGNPVYNNYRRDIADQFPGYANSNGAVGYYYIDTTKYENGLHTIQWTVKDDADNVDGIGSRYFSIWNSQPGGNRAVAQTNQRFGAALQYIGAVPRIDQIPMENNEPIQLQKSFQTDEPMSEIFPGEDGVSKIGLKELQRVAIGMGENVAVVSGYMMNGTQYTPLPIGSTLDSAAGMYYWSPGIGFYGDYKLLFIIKNTANLYYKKIIQITIKPKFSNL
jgi:hypothetical protein